MPFKIRCTCGRKLTAPDSAAGKKVRCPGCGRTFVVPVPGDPPPATAEEVPGQVGPLGEGIPGIAPRPPGSSEYGLKLRDSGVGARTKPQAAGAKGAKTCPFCQVPREPGAVICVNCGLNFQTGQRIVTEEKKPRRERAKQSALLAAFNVLRRPFRRRS